MNYEDRVTKEYVEGLLGTFGNCKVTAGSYIGDDGESVTIEFPFVPKFVGICSTYSNAYAVIRPDQGYMPCTTNGNTQSCPYTMTENVFVLKHPNMVPAWGMNSKLEPYCYFAIG